MATQMTQSKKECCGSPKDCAPKLKPLGNRVLVKRIDAEETLKGGIILPDTAKKKQETARKLSPLAQAKRIKMGVLIPMPVKVGDIILMEKYSGQEVTLEDEEFIIIRADDIIAIVEQ